MAEVANQTAIVTIWRLVPPYMDAETKGKAVRWFKQLFSSLYYPDGTRVYSGQINEYYDEDIRAAVRKLQNFLGFTAEEDVDGFFGPNTRVKFLEVFRIDVDSIPGESNDVTYYASPGVDGLQQWIPGVTPDPRDQIAA